ncbi:MAG TPA: radical SAM protein [Victivallales bacterium]|nr:radical SAM protein [Victivallales bacterium]
MINSIKIPRPAGSFRISDMPFLMSEKSDEHIEDLRRIAGEIKIRNFGRTIRLYRPIYVSNYCLNDCKYCGCGASAKGRRKILNDDEISSEAAAVKADGIDAVLIVSGEDRQRSSVEYLSNAVMILKKHFSYVGMEAGSFDADECRTLLNSGVDSFVLYQETYDEERYASLHKGPKKDFSKRLNALQIAADAGFKSVGMGILLGISDWREDAIALASHAEKFRKKNWTCSVQFSFPRLRPPSDRNFPDFKVSEKDFEKILLSFRLIFPDAEINISTRERAEFRDMIVNTAATTMSAASGTFPGAYSDKTKKKGLRQFQIHDSRTVSEICRVLRKNRLEPVFKYWDRAFSSAI